MKIPKAGLSLMEIYRSWTDHDVVVRVLGRISEPTVNGKYVHWDKLRRLAPPDELTHSEWWMGLKMSRQGQRRFVPLNDSGGGPFSFVIPDPLPEALHHADSGARGAIGAPEAILNREVKDQYVVRSLIEESIRSSQLEGSSTTRDIAKKMIRDGREPGDRSERMILNNYLTMQRILEIKGEKLTPALVFELQQIVTEGTLDDGTGSGRFRLPGEDIVVGDETGEVFHTPPPAGQLGSRMEAMCAFANGELAGGFIHPVIRSMILHFWLAYDHPFIDGNGRTARALFYWSMLRQGYWLFEFLSISRIILKTPSRYGRAFLETETDDNDLTYFLLYHSEVIKRSIDELHSFIDRKTRQLRDVEAELRGMSTLGPRQKALISHALRHPGERYTIESHKTSHATVYETARGDLMDLADRGLLMKSKMGRTWHFQAASDLEDKLREL